MKIQLKKKLIRQLKRTINQCKKLHEEKTHFCKNALLYTLNGISMVLEIIIIKSSCILKIRLEILFLNLNLTVLHTKGFWINGSQTKNILTLELSQEKQDY